MDVFVVIIDFKRLQEIKTYAEIKVLFKTPRYFNFTLSLENKFSEWRFAGSDVLQKPSGVVLLLMRLGRHIDKCQCPSFSCAWLKTMSHLSLFQRTQYSVPPVPVSAEVPDSVQCSTCPCFSWAWLKTVSYLSLFQQTQYNPLLVPISTDWMYCSTDLSLFQPTQHNALPVGFSRLYRPFPRARREFGTSIAPFQWAVWLRFIRGECTVISLDDH